MKILKLILFNTKKLFLESKSMFLFILIGITFAVFGIFFYSGYFMNNYYNTTFINEIEISIPEKSDTATLSYLFDKIEEEKGFVRVTAYNSKDYEDSVDIVGMYEKDFQKNMNCEKLAEKLGITHLLEKKAGLISGGEKQRTAIARALINDPKYIIADEPTGALDSKTGYEIMALFLKLHNDGKTVIIVTHDNQIAKRCEKVIEISDGKIVF